MKKTIILICIAIASIGCKQSSKGSEEPQVVKEISKDEISNNELEWITLFDGTSFNGWHGYLSDSIPEEWSIEDGAMFFNPKEGRTAGGKNIVSNKNYTNFKLSLEWKISKNGNSGIFWGVKEDVKYREAYETGPEIQILDNLNYPVAKVGGEKHQSGALYDMIAPSEDVTKPVGEWNKCVISINHKTNEGSVWLNNVKIVEFPVNGKGWDTMVANSKFKDWEGFGKFTTGKIGLQDHGNKVWFRAIKIQELN